MHRFWTLPIIAAVALAFIADSADAKPQHRSAMAHASADFGTVLPHLDASLHHFRSADFQTTHREFATLTEGATRYHQRVFGGQRSLFQHLSHSQHPKALFITCSDSRIDPNLITQAHPGDLFILRNIGNIVPQYGPKATSEAAVIEYALKVLDVRDIVVCGHTNCGAINELVCHEHGRELPALADWLSVARPVEFKVRTKYAGLSKRSLQNITVEENVLAQIENLKSHPAVSRAINRGELKLHAWIYTMESGQVFNYDPMSGQFIIGDLHSKTHHLGMHR